MVVQGASNLQIYSYQEPLLRYYIDGLLAREKRNLLQPLLPLKTVQLVDQFGQCNLTFVFITVGPGHQQYCRTVTIANTDDGDG